MEIKNQQIKLSKQMLKLAKIKFYSGSISREEYIETLELILKRLNNEELKFNQLEILNSIFQKPEFQINLKDTINIALSMN